VVSSVPGFPDLRLERQLETQLVLQLVPVELQEQKMEAPQGLRKVYRLGLQMVEKLAPPLEMKKEMNPVLQLAPRLGK
jgi:hypothetical protein